MVCASRVPCSHTLACSCCAVMLAQPQGCGPATANNQGVSALLICQKLQAGEMMLFHLARVAPRQTVAAGGRQPQRHPACPEMARLHRQLARQGTASYEKKQGNGEDTRNLLALKHHCRKRCLNKPFIVKRCLSDSSVSASATGTSPEGTFLASCMFVSVFLLVGPFERQHDDVA